MGTGSIKGSQLSDFDEVRKYYNLFSEISYQLNKKWIVDLGVNLNQTAYNIDDKFVDTNENQSGDFDFEPIFSPKMGLLFNVNRNINLKGSVAHGFAPPTTEETLLPEGNINPNLKPEQGWNFELGSEFKFFNDRLYGGVNLYILKVNDLLVNRRSENGALFAINAGKTNHAGIEGSVNYMIYQSKQLSFSSATNFSVYKYKFDTFIDEEENFSDNRLTGVPSGVFNTGISLESIRGWFGNLNFQYVGRIPANDGNTVFSNSYRLVNTKVGYKYSYKKLKFKAFLGINNILDQKYSAQLQVNASSFGGRAPRYYYAGSPVNIYGGVVINYSLF